MAINEHTGEMEVASAGRPVGPTPDRLLWALWQRRLWILLPALLAGALALAWLSQATPLYRSSATVLVESQETGYTRPSASQDRDVVDQEAVRSQEQLILSRDLNREVLRELSLVDHPAFAPSEGLRARLARVLAAIGITRNGDRSAAEQRALEAYYERLTVYQIEQSRVIAIEFSSADPEMSARVVNAVADGYIEMQRRAKHDATRQASQWLSSEIERLRERVEDAEREVEEYRRETGLFGSGAGEGTGRSLAAQELSELTSQLASVRSEKSDARARAEMIREMLDAGAPLEFSVISDSSLIQRLDEERARVRSELAELSSTHGERHPRIRQLQSELADIRSQAREEAERIARALENDARTAARTESELVSDIEVLKNQASEANENEVVLRALERQARSEREQLESMLSRYTEATLRDTVAALPADARIISRANPALDPYFPKPLPVLLGAVIVAVMCSAGVVVTRELMRVGESGATTPVPSEFVPVSVAEARPFIARRPEEGWQALSGLAERFAAPGEDDGGGRVILVTSVRRLQGMADFAMQLSRLVSKKGRRVVLVDTRFTPHSEGSNGTGLSDLLAGESAFDAALQRDPESRVHWLPPGRPGEGGSASLLASQKMETVIRALRQTYDVVVLLAPPVNRGDEAAHLARWADAGVLAVRGHGARASVTRARLQLEDAGIQDVFVLTLDEDHHYSAAGHAA